MRHLKIPDGTSVPVLGQGTWRMGERPAERAGEIRALQTGLDLGMTLVDTAEMYADGGAEEVVGAAVAGRRDSVFIVSKVLPSNASRKGTLRACEQSLRRLGTDRIDLYLLHWQGSHPFAETLEAFTDLQKAGKIGGFGVSNLDLDAMRQWFSLAGASGPWGTQANQVLYNLASRGIDFDLLPDHRRRGLPVMAYSPLGQAGFLVTPGLGRVAARHEATPAQVMLAWTIRLEGVISIPKSSRPERVRENAAAAAIVLRAEDIAELDSDYPPPRCAEPLAMN